MTDPRDPSRRDFLAASAISLIGLARGSESPALRDEAQTDGDLLYVGTYTEGGRSDGIYLVRMDRRSGKLRRVGSVDAGANPSFLAIHPNGRVLYAVNELEKYKARPTGAVSAFAIARDTGALTRLNEQPSEGGAPCYVSVDRSGQVVLVANYVGGSIAVLPIQANGALAPAAHVVQHTGKGPNAERQDAPHAHCILPDPSNRFALAADLGVDRVFVYRLDLDGKSLRHVEGGDAVMRPGAGPRHIAFHPTLPLVFVANELDSTVATLRFDAERGALSPLDTRSTVPAGWTGTNYPADIHTSHPGARCTCRTAATTASPCSLWRNQRARSRSSRWSPQRGLAAQFQPGSDRTVAARRQSAVRLRCRVRARSGERQVDTHAPADRDT